MNNDPTLGQRIHQRDILTSVPAGFNTAEAQQLLEFCIELNNQDDRNNAHKKADPNVYAKATEWKIFYDSRHPGNHEWNKSWPYNPIDDRLKDPNNPDSNGFGPLNNAWILVQSLKDPTVFAIAIRGTVGEWHSILADAYATSIPAYAGIEYPLNSALPVTFAATPKAELHLGFSYASLALLFEDDLGILTQLHHLKYNHKISKLLITGHSQGAAIATLIHSFLYYALTDPNDRYGLKNSLNPDKLKSYVFAQPKPGNLQFAQDFARITKENAYVINNDRDPVPQVPLSLETIAEVTQYIAEDNNKIKVGSWLNHVTESISHTTNSFRDKLAELFSDKMADKFKYANIERNIKSYFPASDEKPYVALADSLNYTLAGQLVPVFGLEQGGDLYPIGSSADSLLQHHASSYRLLISQQLVRQ
jgi:hypothetical protein